MANLIDKPVSELMRSAFLDYSMSVITDRALPDVRDGLKPVHRRILFAMQTAGNMAGKAYRKSARTVGDVIGKYHPHGDTSVYFAAVRMAQPFSLRIPVIDGQGNFGSIDNDPPAAMRYTEMRLSRLATETFFRELKQNTVGWRDNYDGSEREPTVLPLAYPNLLVNGVEGIAVGMASGIPPHNLREVVGVTKLLMANPEHALADLLQIMPGPDFPTGGIGFDRDGYVSAFETGRGRVRLRAKWHVEQRSRGEAIIIDEIPYQIVKSQIVERIAELVKDKEIDDLIDIRDESSKEGIRIWIALKAGAMPELVMSKLFSMTGLEISYSYNCVVLDGGVRPRLMGLRQMILSWITFRRDVVTKRYIFEREQAIGRLHILKGLIAAINMLDETIAAIRNASDRAQAKTDIMALLSIDGEQAEAILEMRLHKLTGLEINKLRAEAEEVAALIAELTAIIESPERIDSIITEELDAIANRFGDDRRTEIDDTISATTALDLIVEEDVVLMMTRKGYVKRIAAATMKRQNRGTRGKRAIDLEDGDEISLMQPCGSKDSLIVLTQSGQAYAIQAYQVPDTGGKGRHIRNLIEGLNEEISATVVASSKDTTQSLLIATKQGLVKRTELSEYNSASRKGGVTGIGLEEGDSIISAATAKDGQDVVLVSQGNKAIRFEVEDVRTVGRVSKGVIGMRNANGIVAMLLVDRASTDDLLVVTENGFGKRTPLSDFRGQGRGGQGVAAFKESDKTGSVVAALAVNDGDDVVAVTSNGVSNRVHSQDIRSTGRVASGVKVIKLDDGAKVVLVNKSDKCEDEADAEANSAANANA